MDTTSIAIRPLPQGLSSRDLHMLLEWIHMAGHVETQTDLNMFLKVISSRLQDYSLMIIYGKTNDQHQLNKMEKVFNLNFSAGHAESYDQGVYAADDPILQMSLDQGAVYWQPMQDSSGLRKPLGKDIAHITYISHASEQQHLASIMVIGSAAGMMDNPIVAILNCLMPHLHQAAHRAIHHVPILPSKTVLSQREHDIFHWLGWGKTNWEIATILDISERTVKFHVANIIRKLNANNRTHAIALGLQHGLVQ